jgi:glycosyltransferase involved in cell wall biosynthesis/ribosomal protein S18 acetylase RimI-like enzyme
MALLEDARALFELAATFRRLRPAIVHTHNPKPGLYGRAAARMAGVPIVVNTLHGLYATPEDRVSKRAIVYGLERLATTCSDAELIQNPEDVAVLQRLRVPNRKLTFLGNGIDLERFDPSSVTARDAASARHELGAVEPTDVVVGVVGRLVREKGLTEVIEAARRLRRHRPELRFAVIGPDEPDKSGSLTPDERSRGADSGVRFLGSRGDVVRLYAAMDVYVLASHREGFPRSAMEAAAMGVPVVATDIRGGRQVVDPDVTGVLIPPRDPAALIDAIADLATDPERRRRMGAAGREKAIREFDQQRCIDLTLSTYRRLLTEAGLQPPRVDASLHSVPFPARSGPARRAELADVASVAQLHMDRFPDGFLPTLGSGPLRRLYRHLVRSANAFVLVADDTEGVAGFIAVSEDTRQVYRDFLRRDGVAAALVAAPAALRAPRRVWETLRYGDRSDHADLPSAEILAVAVAQRARGTGIASTLLAASLSELRRRGVDRARVVTATDNDQALRLYERAGFRRRSFTEVHRGVRQEVLVWP